MCDERDRELIRIDFQIMDLKKQQESCEAGSGEYKEIQAEIERLEHCKAAIQEEKGRS